MVDFDPKVKGYPEIGNLRRAYENGWNEIQEFLDTSGYKLGEWTNDTEPPIFTPLSLSSEQVLAAYFEIDMEQVDVEHQAFLNYIHTPPGR